LIEFKTVAALQPDPAAFVDIDIMPDLVLRLDLARITMPVFAGDNMEHDNSLAVNA
jgi:hypothetical protein